MRLPSVARTSLILTCLGSRARGPEHNHEHAQNDDIAEDGDESLMKFPI
jgi:hypothetical protein